MQKTHYSYDLISGFGSHYTAVTWGCSREFAAVPLNQRHGSGKNKRIANAQKGRSLT
jgi:hypothetical protein